MKKKILLCLLCFMLSATLLLGGIYSDGMKIYANDSYIDKAINWAIAIANDNSHGYSQENRWGNPDYDCSSFVIGAFRAAGFSLTGASYTQNMISAFTQEGFIWIPVSEIDLASSYSLQRGDILLNDSSDSSEQHTEIYIGNGQNVGAFCNRGNPEGGDQYGNEIAVVGYYSHPWTGILRYTGTGTEYLSKKKAAPRLRVWVTNRVSAKQMGSAITGKEFRYGGFYYLCYELVDQETGKRFDGDGYSVKETLYKPDGKTATEYVYENSSQNWIAHRADASGEWKGKVEISGDFIGDSSVCYSIPDVDGMAMHAYFSTISLNKEAKELEKGEMYDFDCELVQRSTGKYYNELIDRGDYTIRLTVKDPNGEIVASKVFEKTDQAKLSFQANEEGKYTGQFDFRDTDSFEVKVMCEKAK